VTGEGLELSAHRNAVQDRQCEAVRGGSGGTLETGQGNYSQEAQNEENVVAVKPKPASACGLRHYRSPHFLGA
jgi:hypothetical protein